MFNDLTMLSLQKYFLTDGKKGISQTGVGKILEMQQKSIKLDLVRKLCENVANATSNGPSIPFIFHSFKKHGIDSPVFLYNFSINRSVFPSGKFSMNF